MTAAVEERVRLPSGGLELEAVLAYSPEETDAVPVLLLPPHPNFAGDLHNNVVRALAGELGGGGFAALRLNYRGVGESDIELPAGATVFDYWRRVEEEKLYEPIVDDALAALAWLLTALAADRAVLVGYSFGAIIGGLAACRDGRVARLVAIAPPLRRYSFDFLRPAPLPMHFIFSDHDFLYDEADVRRFAAGLGARGSTTVLESPDHFFRGVEGELARRVRDDLEESPT